MKVDLCVCVRVRVIVSLSVRVSVLIYCDFRSMCMCGICVFGGQVCVLVFCGRVYRLSLIVCVCVYVYCIGFCVRVRACVCRCVLLIAVLCKLCCVCLYKVCLCSMRKHCKLYHCVLCDLYVPTCVCVCARMSVYLFFILFGVCMFCFCLVCSCDRCSKLW